MIRSPTAINIIYGVPMNTENESSEQATKLCLKLFAAIGFSDCTIQDIDIAHRLPARNASNRPDAIVCKFTRPITKERIMATRNQISNVTANQLKISGSVPLNRSSIFDNLTPKQQKLFYEAKKYKESKSNINTAGRSKMSFFAARMIILQS